MKGAHASQASSTSAWVTLCRSLRTPDYLRGTETRRGGWRLTKHSSPGGPTRGTSWASTSGFRPSYLSVAGGMPVSASTNSVLLITHPGGGRSFNYEDYWDKRDLIYTGRGKVGPQEWSGANLDVAENRSGRRGAGGRNGGSLRFLTLACASGSPGRRSRDRPTGRVVLDGVRGRPRRAIQTPRLNRRRRRPGTPPPTKAIRRPARRRSG
jgi:hypothetical protein